MRTFIYVFLAGILLFPDTISAQISHGGSPLPFIPTRAMNQDLFVEMPPFDPEEALHLESLEQDGLRGSYRFAYKFMADLDRWNSGINFTLEDGTRVWRVGIRSADAFSLNILFSEYELPEGACVFLYNPSQTYVLGGFNHLNNSEQGILPVAPVPGEELIIEYREPAHAVFSGRLKIGEVNHGYRDIRGAEPGGNLASLYCMPSPVCYDDPDYEDWNRSVVLLIIDGTLLCSGVMVNNTLQDGTPYLLTASHCINRNFSVSSSDYERIAGTIVSFFNYESPVCDGPIRGAEEMSVASSQLISMNEGTDMALLKLPEIPPNYYRPYYAGWNAEDKGNSPYVGIHHPHGSFKRLITFSGNLALSTLNLYEFYRNVHWYVNRWDIGCTAGGSSGSPLFDADGYVVGALSAGASTCRVPMNDYYFALSETWLPDEPEESQLACWLDPSDKGILTCDGMDPYQSETCVRISNIYNSGKQEEIETTLYSSTAYLFGNNELGVNEYLEKYTHWGDGILYGVYLVTPAFAGRPDVEIVVYEGNEKPETLIYNGTFNPTYTNLASDKLNFQETLKPVGRDQESFVLFDEPVFVSGNFFVGYRILSEGEAFTVFNLPEGESALNTTWLYYKDEWIEQTVHPAHPFSTSLFIDPVIQTSYITSNEKVEKENPVRLFLGPDKRMLSVMLPPGVKQAGLKIYSIQGQQVKEEVLSDTLSHIPLYIPASGVYIIKVVYDKNEYIQKVLL